MNFTDPKENPFSDPEVNSEKTSLKEAKERQSYQEITERFREKLEQSLELLRENPFFHSQGRDWEIKNAVDCIRAKAQINLKLGKEILEEVREQGDYFKEKAAAKLAAFLEVQEKALSFYVELKAYHPEMATGFEEQMPWLKEAFQKAEQIWETLNNSHG